MNSDPKLDLPEKILMFTKTLPSENTSSESLFVIQNYNFELREIWLSKQELLKETEVQRSKSESELKSLEFTIENMNGEIEKINFLLQGDVENENNWKTQLKQAERNKVDSVREYQSKMATYRNSLFSCLGVNKEAITMRIEEISSGLEQILKEVDEAEVFLNETITKFKTTQTSFDDDLIKSIQTLSSEILAAERKVEKDCEVLESEIQKMTKQMKPMSYR